MSSLYRIGLETNDFSEFSSHGQDSSISSTIANNGIYSLKIIGNGVSKGGYANKNFSTTEKLVTYRRFYFYIETSTDATDDIFFSNSNTGGAMVEIRMNSTNQLLLYNGALGTQVGSNSSALSLNTWYRIELKIDTTTIASTLVDAQIDGVSFASGTIDLSSSGGIGVDTDSFAIGVNGSITQGVVYYDDLGGNDNSGSTDNTFLGKRIVNYANTIYRKQGFQ